MPKIFFILAVIAAAFFCSACASISSDAVWNDAAMVTRLQSELDAANARIADLEGRQQSALAVVERTDERFAELGRISAAEGATLSGLIERQRRIEELVAAIWGDYIRLKDGLGGSDGNGTADGGTAQAGGYGSGGTDGEKSPP